MSGKTRATYSEILAETGISTGRLNYHLKEVELELNPGRP